MKRLVGEGGMCHKLRTTNERAALASNRGVDMEEITGHRRAPRPCARRNGYSRRW